MSLKVDFDHVEYLTESGDLSEKGKNRLKYLCNILILVILIVWVQNVVHRYILL